MNALPWFDSDDISLRPGDYDLDSVLDSTVGPSYPDITLSDLGGIFAAPDNLGVSFEDSTTLTIDPRVLNASCPLAQNPAHFSRDVPCLTPRPDGQQLEQMSGSAIQEMISFTAQSSTSLEFMEMSVSGTSSNSSGNTTPSVVTERLIPRFACKVASCSEHFVERRQLE